jgi:hypothetical protein
MTTDLKALQDRTAESVALAVAAILRGVGGGMLQTDSLEAVAVIVGLVRVVCVLIGMMPERSADRVWRDVIQNAPYLIQRNRVTYHCTLEEWAAEVERARPHRPEEDRA